ncbi:14742_t:CDS:2 [Acaulospora colombiana]|uniref:14742_t:CDS:1 n=1 Tax=Acaulospora colombiana TaxID=27376 RepID=A0ACA9N2V6_9GLOM|nr:14742_t:CDS:2 [Acaulospora colombiana]
MSGKGKKKAKTIKLSTNKSSSDPDQTKDSAANKTQAEPDRTKYQETTDGFILGFNIVREISEATGLLAPLKATFAMSLDKMAQKAVRLDAAFDVFVKKKRPPSRLLIIHS